MSPLVRILAPGLVALLLIAPPGVARVAQPDSSALPPEERVHGLATIWKEAAYNFPYFDQLPDLDWDRAYREAIPSVLAAETTLAYYRERHRFAALLREGHAHIRLPHSIIQRHPFSSPRVELEAVGGRALVCNVSAQLADSVPIGSVITSVDGQSVDAYLKERSSPGSSRPSLTAGESPPSREATRGATDSSSDARGRRCRRSRTLPLPRNVPRTPRHAPRLASSSPRPWPCTSSAPR